MDPLDLRHDFQHSCEHERWLLNSVTLNETDRGLSRKSVTADWSPIGTGWLYSLWGSVNELAACTAIFLFLAFNLSSRRLQPVVRYGYLADDHTV